MKRLVAVIALLAIVGFVTTARAADDATGTWKWTSMFNNNSVESTLKLKQEGDKLTGVYVGRNNTESPIEEGTIKDNAVSFKIVREFNGNKFTMKYSGTLSGDTIKGKSSFDRDGQAQERDWEAKRQK
ncbi:MAG TPA: hypothetical protein VKH44_03805 [Pirellulaceae bacterium]|nr:hypothetical protein [Pirellulaceae bacterium]